jgi:N-sulfoglucosamine sulfohydrolase
MKTPHLLLQTWTVGLCLLLLGPSHLSADSPTPPPPNILFAIADDWGWPHAGAYGDQTVATPTFDRLAREGALLHHAFISSPSCTPSRSAILTGQWHWRLKESANLWSTLSSSIPVYPDILEDAGYFVGLTSKGWGPGRPDVGGRNRNPAGPSFPDFKKFLESRSEKQPFCFWLGSSDPHRPYEEGSGKESGMNLDLIKIPGCFPDSDTVRSDVADYYWEVQRFDQTVASALELLEEIGELDNTIVVMTGDHGMPFPRCKGNLYDSGSRVPLAIRFPRWMQQGNLEILDFVSLTDLAPTFLEAAGVEIPCVMTGRSLAPILKSASSGWVSSDRSSVLIGKERHVPSQEAQDSGGTPMRGIRNQDYLLIHNFTPERWPAGTPNYKEAFIPGTWYGDVDNGPTKTYMIENQSASPTHQRLFELAFGKRPEWELYDNRMDPDQLHNVAADPAYAAVLRQLSKQLSDELAASEDPRSSGQGATFDTYPYYGGGPMKPGYRPEAK